MRNQPTEIHHRHTQAISTTISTCKMFLLNRSPLKRHLPTPPSPFPPKPLSHPSHGHGARTATLGFKSVATSAAITASMGKRGWEKEGCCTSVALIREFKGPHVPQATRLSPWPFFGFLYLENQELLKMSYPENTRGF